MPQLPEQRWTIHAPQPEQAEAIAEVTHLPPLLAQVLINRGITSPAEADAFLHPEQQKLPLPLQEFEDLAISLELLAAAIAQKDKIAICGDYDTDGMTSTALLLRALRHLGAKVDYAIPSRMTEGYGLNQRIVEEFHREGVRLILTVDNGISAMQPVSRARELGVAVIITDHHDLPETLPPANAILNPKLLPITSPYRGLAGVGVAYVLAVSLAQHLGRGRELFNPLLELFTLGTIADMAPLTGVNRRWVKKGLKLLPQSQLAGVQALMQVSGLGGTQEMKSDAIGFRLGPRINAVGRIGDPTIAIELLTTDDSQIAWDRATDCEQINKQRQQLCQQIEIAAVQLIEEQRETLCNWQRDRVLLPISSGWHHGVIGLVASRLVERYGVPVFIGTYEDEDQEIIRGSARSIPEFNVFAALEFCGDLLEKYGGHQAAGGFSLKAIHLEAFRSRLRTFAHQCLELHHLKPLVEVDVQADLAEITYELLEGIDRLQPCGIHNPDPVFWTPNVQVVHQKTFGKDQAYLKLTFKREVANDTLNPYILAKAWRWGDLPPLPNCLDVAYKVGLNEWNGEEKIELTLVGLRLPQSEAIAPVHFPTSEDWLQQLRRITVLQTPVDFIYKDRPYCCKLVQQDSQLELRIRNEKKQVLMMRSGQQRGWIRESQVADKEVDLFQLHYANLVQAALAALAIASPSEGNF